jgi:hypothetical protein
MSVGFIQWNRPGLCGAACAHMALHALTLVGSSLSDQESIWTSIKDHTHGRSTTQCCVAVPESFAMMRDVCPGANCAKCWWSYPTALRAALSAKLGKGTPVMVRKSASQNTANSIIRSCLARKGVAIVNIDGGIHWVVVDDWDPVAQKVSLLDPAYEEPDWIDVDMWNDRMMVVECGVYDNKYVVVEVG